MTKTEPMTAVEATKALGVRLNYTYILLREGRLRATRDKRNEWQIDPNSVAEYAAQREARKAMSA